MKTQSPLVTLRELAQKEVEKAVGQLGQVRQAHQQAEQQLNMLLNYQDDYRQKLNSTMSAGMANNSWQNYQQFIRTLDSAIEQHRQQLSQWTSRLDLAMKTWQEKQQRLNAFEKLQDRELTRQLAKENKIEQKQMDEFAQRASQRKAES
ncbi:flagellar export protein FliJ [Pectobacterium aroidearum]|uniref:flagellar export protein FliJ n=1 Tax=Pectobacterium aroidearum TaxID=1201031 RepID=UPI002113DE6A|nr:flagellar export protein FliJ [Pectobacterium aroidearum]UUE46610.1 flagella biosynthesis chaperone FliJ [Pectobacterium aroidearum]UUE50807.1 flagella biosynthesis chaperone FliJ [Pectobacterium aroidearum]UUE55035.1 flagella biosynthesis chaperone FliJ [Pectobacterium aroidearum]UUE63444.1 flagella biosynthesis chaperone FliJ [Pectobacterium aroidearum]UUE67668.1 flagella biosynthesis chaperone FliJ [Pectobacterium aroidearum]